MINGKLEQQIVVRLAKNEKDSLKWTANPSYATKNIDIDLKSTSNKSKLLLIDTDSLVQKIETKNVYEDFSKNKELFGFNNYSAKSKY